MDKDIGQHLHNLIVKLSRTDEKLTTIIGKDKGIYGETGY